MAVFFASKKDDKFATLHHRLTNSFAYVRNDISALRRNEELYKQWISYLHQKLQAQEREMSSLMELLKQVPKAPQDIKQIIDEHYHFEDILKRIEQLNRQVDEVLVKHQPLNKRLEEHHQRITNLEQSRPVAHFKEKMVQKITRQSKDYVKGLILSLIRKYDKASGTQLREIIVEEQALCSKSSFYRILSELEESRQVSVIEDSKEKYYLPLQLRKQAKD
ncbi:MAG: hypothetical protein V1837_03195 [Candidatus Woesearchaeota archaeon]